MPDWAHTARKTRIVIVRIIRIGSLNFFMKAENPKDLRLMFKVLSPIVERYSTILLTKYLLGMKQQAVIYWQ